MKKIFAVATMLFVTSMCAYAQDAEYPKMELAGTFSLVRQDVDILDNETLAGYGIGLQYNVNSFFGLAGEWNATHGSSGPYTLAQGGRLHLIPKVDTRVQTLLFGPRVSLRSRVVTVFGHWLVGAGTNKLDDDIGTYDYKSYTAWQFAMGVGGGLDLNLGKNFALRPAQFDWLPIDSDLEDQGGPTGLFHNIRYQAGVVIKF